MTVFFIIGFIVSLVARILFGFFVNKVAVFAEQIGRASCRERVWTWV